VCVPYEHITMVPYKCVTDGVDSLNSNNDIAPFKNILNDMYAKDISVKIKSALHAKARRGEFLGSYSPYGYLKDPNDRHHLVVNPEVAPNVKRLFDLAASGYGFSMIAKMFNAEGILSPGDYADFRKHNPVNGEFAPKYKWDKTVLTGMAHNQMYVGDMVQCRKRTVSYRNHDHIWNPKEDWIIVKSTHDGIVSRELYDQVQKIISSRTRIIKKSDEPHFFSGLFYCENCGRRMAHHVREGYGDYFSCGRYRAKGSTACSSHHIKVETLKAIVLADIQKNVRLLQADEDRAVRRILEVKNTGEEKRLAAAKKELVKQKNRQSDINLHIKRVYEDNISGKLPDELFRTFLQDYEAENVALRDSVRTLEETVNDIEANQTDISKFISLLRQFAGMTELTRPVLMTLIDKISIEEPADSFGRTHHPQTVHIHYKYAGEL